ncbi:Phage tail tape measure protein [Tenacibaculum maritimum]|uniref:phage tail tape measure protein n=1 Tax=Tenacibaculum maritimum TaxID=107401 RepID=UPI0012E544E2|nr:phage tail tape measure protein [Tenacibaculum maritimum]CAA0228644.1 Phage tail tape measure protein [Tenacibaculum maritimum]
MAATNTQWILELIDKISKPLKDIDSNVKAVATDSAKMNTALENTSAISINAVADSFRSLKDRLNEAVQPGIDFQDGLADVEAITGITGDALDSLGAKARKSAIQFGGDASDSLENYKVILSKLGPGIGKSEEALSSMNTNVLTLSKTMGGDTTAAVEALTTSMLQYRVDLSDPIAASKEMTAMMNVMAAGAKEGSAEVSQVSAAVKVAGVANSQAKVSFVESNAAIQELARGGKVGAEGGMALRNVLGKMAGTEVIPKQALEKLNSLGVNMKIVSDTSLPLTTRLRELGKAQDDATAFAQVFGTENAAAAAILTRSVDAQDQLQTKITGTNTAVEQAQVKMNTYSELLSRSSAWMKDLGISTFKATESFLPFINKGFGAIDVLADLKNAQQGVSMIMKSNLGTGLKNIGGKFKKAGLSALGFTKNLMRSGWAAVKSSAKFVITSVVGIASYIGSVVSATAAQWGLNTAMSANPIGLIVLGIAAAVGAIVLLVKNWNWIKEKIVQFAKFMWKLNPFGFLINLVDKIFPGFKQKVQEIFNKVMGFAMAFWEKIKGVFNAVKSFLGFGSDETVSVEGTVKNEVAEGESFKASELVGLKPNGLKDKANNTAIASVQTEEPVAQLAGVGSPKQNTTQQTISINQTFTIDQNVEQKIEEIADKVLGRITGKLKDYQLA